MIRLTATLAFLALSAATAMAFPGTGILTLTTPDSSQNRLTVKISASASGTVASDTKTTDVSGILNAAMDIDPATRGVTRFTINGGDILMSDMLFKLRASLFITVATINTIGMRGTAFTRVPPGNATPTATGGTFDASQHSLWINQGTITGSITIPLQPATPINANFTDSPVEGLGNGTGSLQVVLGTATSTHRNCTVTMTLPVDFTDALDLDGTPVTVTVKGTIKATGNIPVPLNSWIDWTLFHNLTNPGFTTIPAPGAAPLGLAWAMGFDPGVPASRVTPTMNGGALHAATLVLPATGTRGPLRLEQSDSLTSNSWQLAPATAVSLGQNPLPVGTSGTVTVQWPSSATRRFIRIAAQKP